MADNNNIPAYPYMFDPSQYSNKYSSFGGTQIPGWPTQYYGTPTDALGRPIQSYLDAQTAHNAWDAQQAQMPPSTTLNSTPQSSTYGMTPQVFNALQQQGIQPSQMGAAGIGAQMAGSNAPAGIQALYGRNFAAFQTPQAAQPQAAPQAAAPTNPIDMNQAYLNALANPGKVVTPGATVPQAPTPTGQSGVLQQFLQNWQNKGSPTTGAGNYNNAGFFNALQGQV